MSGPPELEPLPRPNSSPRRPAAAARTGCVLLLAGITACSVTVRRPEIPPLDTARSYPVEAARACAATVHALESLRLEVSEVARNDDSCILETDYQRIGAPGSPFDDLDQVGYVTGATFAHGRYLLTATIRSGDDGDARVRFASRLEGYDGGYRTVRSNGTIENTAFERLGSELGVAPREG